LGYGIQRVKIVVYGDECQVAKLDGNGMCKHQRAVPENKYPENISQQPKNEVI